MTVRLWSLFLTPLIRGTPNGSVRRWGRSFRCARRMAQEAAELIREMRSTDSAETQVHGMGACSGNTWNESGTASGTNDSQCEEENEHRPSRDQ